MLSMPQPCTAEIKATNPNSGAIVRANRFENPACVKDIFMTTPLFYLKIWYFLSIPCNFQKTHTTHAMLIAILGKKL
jgi:hypothetical protein